MCRICIRNSAIGDLKPEPAGAVIVGSILVNIDETSENIILPDKRVSLTAMRDGINFHNVKSITANRAQTVINLRHKLPVGIKIILKDKSYITDEQLSEWSPFPILELTEENPYYSTKDGCLLSKDGLVLVKYPSAISGQYIFLMELKLLHRMHSFSVRLRRYIFLIH